MIALFAALIGAAATLAFEHLPAGRIVVPAIVVVGAVVAAARWRSTTSRARPLGVLDPASEAWVALGRELQRHRRHERPLSVCRVELDDAALRIRDAEAIAAALRPRLRAGEHVFVESGDLYLILPETKRVDAPYVLARLGLETGVGDLTRGFSVATFPDDALTAGALARLVARQRSATESPDAEVAVDALDPLASLAGLTDLADLATLDVVPMPLPHADTAG